MKITIYTLSIIATLLFGLASLKLILRLYKLYIFYMFNTPVWKHEIDKPRLAIYSIFFPIACLGWYYLIYRTDAELYTSKNAQLANIFASIFVIIFCSCLCLITWTKKFYGKSSNSSSDQIFSELSDNEVLEKNQKIDKDDVRKIIDIIIRKKWFSTANDLNQTLLDLLIMNLHKLEKRSIESHLKPIDTVRFFIQLHKLGVLTQGNIKAILDREIVYLYKEYREDLKTCHSKNKDMYKEEKFKKLVNSKDVNLIKETRL